MKKASLNTISWMSKFRTSECGLNMVKSALTKGKAIGVYNPFGQILWLPKESLVLPIIDNNP